MAASRLSLLLLLLLLPAACADGTDTESDPSADADTDTDTDLGAGCAATIVSVDPGDHASGVGVDALVTVGFDLPVATTAAYDLAVVGVEGVTTLAADGLSMTFTPSLPLALATTYTVEGQVCDSRSTSTFATCAGGALSTFPEDGDTDAYYRTAVHFTLWADDPTAHITVTSAVGVPVPGTTTVEGVLVSWAGSEALTPDTAYTATLEGGCGSSSVDFTTSSTGAPITADPVGGVYHLDVAGSEWIAPAGIGDLIAAQLSTIELLLMPTELTASTVTMIAAYGDGTGRQDVCSPTPDLGTAGTWVDPWFERSYPVLTLQLAGVDLVLTDVTVSGAFAADVSRIQGGTLEGVLDTRTLGVLLGATGTGSGAFCDLVAIFGVACAACADGAGDYCLPLAIEDVEAQSLPSAPPLVELTQADIDADPACN